MTQLVDTAADNETTGQGATVAPQAYVLGDVPGPLAADELRLIDAWWRAANYLSVGQIYLRTNPLLRRPLEADDVKPRLLGHFGTVPGLNLVYAHANRAIKARDFDAVFIAGPGHGGPGPNACAWLEGTYSELWPHIGTDERGLAELFRQFSAPGGVPSHCAPETPGSFHEGGELGYSLLHAYGAALDHPDLVVVCVVGDGEAETGALATSWHCAKFINPARDGAVLPVLHLNEYKIANPTLLARIPEDELLDLLRGYGYAPTVVSGADPAAVHQALAAALDTSLDLIRAIQGDARRGDATSAAAPARWPMIVLRTPKGWTCPPVVDGQPVEGTFRAHQVPLSAARQDDEHRRVLEAWLRSYRPEELFDDDGRVVAELQALPPVGTRRMSANPVANGGVLLRDLQLPDWREYGVDVARPGAVGARGDARPRDVAARRHPRQPVELPDVRPRRAGQQPATGHPRGHRPGLAGRDRSVRRPSRSPRAGHRSALGAHLPGDAGGLPADRPPWRVHVLRGLHPHRRRHVQPARQVAVGQCTPCHGGGASPASTISSPRTSGARTTTASPTRTPVSSTS